MRFDSAREHQHRGKYRMSYITLRRLLEINFQPLDAEFDREYHEAGYILPSLQIDMRDPQVQANLSIKDVPIAELHPTQFEFDVERIGTLPDSDPDDHLPFVINLKGELLILDGHHRVIRARRRGDTVIRARVLEMQDLWFDEDNELQVQY